MSRYLGAFSETNDFKIQELIRIIDATLGDVNPNGLHTGHNALAIIKFLSCFPGLDRFVSENFFEEIQKQVQLSITKDNVRENVKKVLMHPRNAYLPWVDYAVDKELVSEIERKVGEARFKIKIVEGKVYGVCQVQPTVNKIVFEYLKDKLPVNLKENIETCHITIVNSNIVSDIGVQKVESFMEKFNLEFVVGTGKIKSTFSEDWSRFGECYVIEITCAYIDGFLESFNKEFNKNVKIQKHITFAIEPRSVWQT